MSDRGRLSTAHCWVIKVGSALLTNNGLGLDLAMMNAWVSQMCFIREQGIDVVLVSSGAIAAGMERLGWQERPDAISQLQAAAAVGQMRLVQAWEAVFQSHNIQSAQILLTHADHSNRQRYLNARGTLKALMEHKIVPVVNENDTVVTDEIRFGDNDTLAALVANLIEADVLVLLTDQDGLFTEDPRNSSDAVLIDESLATNPDLEKMASGSAGRLGCGGMQTKLRAGRLVASSGAATVIANGRTECILQRLYDQQKLGTLLLPDKGRMAARKQWLYGHMKTSGELVIDKGAVNMLTGSGTSLLSVGVILVNGYFQRGEMVTCVDESGVEVARGLINYGSADASKIIGMPSSKILGLLGYKGEDELIHRDNMVMV
ncbi:MAG: glutamate 5-kinase [Candidatus Endonucleobacter bathymodioli]|uniref:Glutamate 5-kinase n=1 Tax=Candidatus Endonucleibacter bathymodioli TaxID=539814 RepID=A0AA90NX71_9GAMM|nr:glutamate 5-kinase [Candidatus Endonucleobacter bathymodioli]